MSPAHHISHLTTEVSFGALDHALAWEGRLPAFVSNGLARVVDDVMDRVCPGHETVRLNRLVLDLGRIHPDRFEADLSRKLGTALQEALEKEIRSGQAITPFSEMSARLFEIILSGSRQNIDPFWIPMVAAHGRETRAWLRRKGKNPVVRKHIARLFPKERLRELVRLFEPVHHRFLIYFIDRPQALLVREILKAEREGAFKRQVTEFILAFLMAEAGSRFNKKVFLSSVIGQISSHYNIRYQGLLTSLIRLFRTNRETSPLQKEILGFLLELKAGEADHPLILPDPPGKGVSLISFSKGKNVPTREEKQMLYRLVRSDPGAVAGFILEHRSDPNVIRRFALALDPKDGERLVNQIHPGRGQAVSQYAQALGRARYAGLFAGTAEAARAMVWEAVLAFAPPFEDRPFLKALLTRVAGDSVTGQGRNRLFSRLIIRLVLDSQKKREHYELLKAVLELKGLDSGLALLREKGIENMENALAFFRHYLRHSRNRERMARMFQKPRIEKLIRLIQPFESDLIIGVMTLSEACLGQAAGGKSDAFTVRKFTMDFLAGDETFGFNRKNYLAGLVRKMASSAGISYEAQLFRFRSYLDETSKGNPVARQAAAVLRGMAADLASDHQIRKKEDTAQDLVMIYLTRILPEKGNETSYLINAVKKYEGRARNLKAYYAAILEGLVLKRAIDFESILEPEPVLPPAQPSGVKEKITGLMTARPVLLAEFVQAHIRRPGFAAILVSALSPVLLHRLLYLIRPRDYSGIRQMADMLEKTISKAFGLSSGKKLDQMVWKGIFAGLSRLESAHDLDRAEFARGFLERVSILVPRGKRSFYARMEAALTPQDIKPSNERIRQVLARVILAEASGEKGQAGTPPPSGRIPAMPAAAPPAPETPLETLYPDNAGLVLAAPYLPGLFKSLDLIRDRGFKTPADAVKGVRVLQYMADPGDESPLSRLVLNRILCGMDPPLPKDPKERLSDKEKETAQSLIRGMIQNWKTIGNTSVEGFRESFVLRAGTLTLAPDKGWHLKVEPRAFDMLLDSIPWSFATIRLPWMTRGLYVTWR